MESTTWIKWSRTIQQNGELEVAIDYGFQYVIYMENNAETVTRVDSRRIFLKDLDKNLVIPYNEKRTTNHRVCQHFGTKPGIKCMLG